MPWLQLRSDRHSTAIQPHYGHSMTYVTTVRRPTCVRAAHRDLDKQLGTVCVTVANGSAATDVTSL